MFSISMIDQLLIEWGSDSVHLIIFLCMKKALLMYHSDILGWDWGKLFRMRIKVAIISTDLQYMVGCYAQCISCSLMK